MVPLILQDEEVNNTANAQHFELVADNELVWTDWFGFQGADLTEEVVAPQGILTRSCVLKICSVWMLHRIWHFAAPYQAVWQTDLAMYPVMKPSCHHDAQFVLQILFNPSCEHILQYKCCKIYPKGLDHVAHFQVIFPERYFMKPKELIVLQMLCPAVVSCRC